jgi:hypothetical protein
MRQSYDEIVFWYLDSFKNNPNPNTDGIGNWLRLARTEKAYQIARKEIIVSPRLPSAAQMLAFSFGLDRWPGQLGNQFHKSMLSNLNPLI